MFLPEEKPVCISESVFIKFLRKNLSIRFLFSAEIFMNFVFETPVFSGLHSDPRVERAGDHHGPDPERHQPAGQDQDGSRPGAQEQRQQAPPRHYGV